MVYITSRRRAHWFAAAASTTIAPKITKEFWTATRLPGMNSSAPTRVAVGVADRSDDDVALVEVASFDEEVGPGAEVVELRLDVVVVLLLVDVVVLGLGGFGVELPHTQDP